MDYDDDDEEVEDEEVGFKRKRMSMTIRWMKKRKGSQGLWGGWWVLKGT